MGSGHIGFLVLDDDGEDVTIVQVWVAFAVNEFAVIIVHLELSHSGWKPFSVLFKLHRQLPDCGGKIMA